MTNGEDTPGTPPPEPPSGQGSTPAAPEGAKRRSDRDLIEAALEQAAPILASPASGTVTFGAPSPLSDTFPGYEILREVHRGGQGVVYQALQKATRRKVAIKVIHGGPFTGSTGRARFEREVQVLGQLSHPNIVRIHDSGVTPDGSFYYVMDYISGRTLDEVLRDERRPSVDETLRLFAKVCDAVNAAHLKGVIHRDLKPGNIRVDASGEPIVVDFGLAKIAVPDVTEDEDHTPRLMTVTGQFVGSLPWASPEQAMGLPGNIDVRTDVYSLGVILYQMLTGRFPYEVIGTMRDVLDNILRTEPARPSTIRRQINDEVETIVLKCLSKDKERRYQSAGELARDIKRYLGGDPIEAKRDSGLYILSKTLKRHRAPAAAAAAALAVIVVFAVFMTYQYRVANAARLEEADQRAQAQRARAAAEEAGAAARDNFNALHELTTTLVGEVEKRLTDLMGATEARLTLLDAVTRQGARLESGAGARVDVLRDLAHMYTLAGDVRGDLYDGKAGDTARMIEWYQRGSDIRRELLAEHPGAWWALLDSGDSRVREAIILQTQNKRPEVIETLDHAIQALALAHDAARTQNAGDAALRETSRALLIALERRADALITLAGLGIAQAGGPDTQSLLDRAAADIARIEDGWTRLRDLAPDHGARADRHLAAAADRTSEVHATRSRLLRALAAGPSRDDPRAAGAFFAQAIEAADLAAAAAQAAVAGFLPIAEASPTSAVALRDLFTAHHNVGAAIMEKANAQELWAKAHPSEDLTLAAKASHDAALPHFRAALAVAQRLAEADPRNQQARREVAIAANKLGRTLRDLSGYEESDEFLQLSLTLRRQILAADPTLRHSLDLVVALEKIGLLYGAWALDSPADLSLAQQRFDIADRAYVESGEVTAPYVDAGQLRPTDPFVVSILWNRIRLIDAWTAFVEQHFPERSPIDPQWPARTAALCNVAINLAPRVAAANWRGYSEEVIGALRARAERLSALQTP